MDSADAKIHFKSVMNENIKHIEGRSYTEDNILIYTLYVSPIAAKASEEDLQGYFGKFGEVEKVSIITKKNNSKRRNDFFRFAFICFKEPESAAKALRSPMHNLFRRNMTVRCADSWKQPFQKNITEVEEGENNVADESPSDTYSILNLNDDCLFVIFKYLSFKEQIKMSKLCIRLGNIFELLFKTSKTLDIDCAQQLTLMEFRNGLQKMGHHIEHITFSSGIAMKNFTRFIDFVSLFCPNLLDLKLESLHFKHVNVFRKISTNLLFIKHLELKNCSINDDMTKLLSQITTIEYLDLTQNYEITGQYLQKFNNLKTLILNSCANIQSSYFQNMCRKVNKLIELNIRRCDRLNTAAFDSMVKNLTDLETLTICTCYQTSDFDKVTELKSLKHLTINHSTISSDTLFNKLAEHKSNQLETLKVTNFTLTDSKARSIKELIKLKQLDLPFAGNLSKSFLNDLAKSSNLKILNIPGCQIDLDYILNFIGHTRTIEFIDISNEEMNEKFFTKVIEILRRQHRITPLTLQIGKNDFNAESNKIIEENSALLKIDTTPTSYVMERFDATFDMLDDDLSSDDFDLDDDDDFPDYDSDMMDDSDFGYEFLGLDLSHERYYYFPEFYHYSWGGFESDSD